MAFPRGFSVCYEADNIISYVKDLNRITGCPELVVLKVSENISYYKL